MKRLIPFALCGLLLVCMGAVKKQTDDIYIVNSDGQIKLKIVDPTMGTTGLPWLEFGSQTNVVFSLPASGILPVAYGGTGSATGATTNSARVSYATNSGYVSGKLTNDISGYAAVATNVLGKLTNDISGYAAVATNVLGTLTNDTTGNAATATYVTVATLTNNVSGSIETATYVSTPTMTNNISGTAASAGYVTGTLTNLSAVDSATITGLTGDGIRLAVRKAASQSNNVFEVQTEANVLMFGVNSNGVVIGNGSQLTNIPPAAIAGMTIVTNTFVTGIVVNENGFATNVTTTNIAIIRF